MIRSYRHHSWKNLQTNPNKMNYTLNFFPFPPLLVLRFAQLPQKTRYFWLLSGSTGIMCYLYRRANQSSPQILLYRLLDFDWSMLTINRTWRNFELLINSNIYEHFLTFNIFRQFNTSRWCHSIITVDKTVLHYNDNAQ